MSEQKPDLSASLKKPFPIVDTEWRVQQSGEKSGKPWAMVLCYATNRAIMKRLDDVCGPMNWKNEYKASPDGGVMCGISIYHERRNEWVTKWDGAENTQVEPVKGGLSGAMKRAAVQWGIGRYLYYLTSQFATCHLDKSGKNRGKAGNIYFTWDDPKLPLWALPKSKVNE